MQAINSRLQKTAFGLVKEANNAGGTGQYALNSYAFHPKSLINSLQSFLNNADTKKIESLFVDGKDEEKETLNPLLNNNTDEKVKRKRVLISSDYKTAFKVKQVFDVYYELNQSHWYTKQYESKKFKQFIQTNIADLSQRYSNGVIYLAPPVQKVPKVKKITDEDDEDEEEYLQHQQIQRTYKLNKWKYSLFNKANVHLIKEEVPSPVKIPPQPNITKPFYPPQEAVKVAPKTTPISKAQTPKPELHLMTFENKNQ